MDSAAETQEGRRRIGEVFVELGFVTGEQLDAALATQRRTGGRVGEILVEQGAMSRLDLASALAEHWEPRRLTPARRSISLAEAGPVRPFEPGDAAEGAPGEPDLAGSTVAGLETARRADRGASGARLASLERDLEELRELRRADALALGVRLRVLEAAVADLASRLEQR